MRQNTVRTSFVRLLVPWTKERGTYSTYIVQRQAV